MIYPIVIPIVVIMIYSILLTRGYTNPEYFIPSIIIIVVFLSIPMLPALGKSFYFNSEKYSKKYYVEITNQHITIYYKGQRCNISIKDIKDIQIKNPLLIFHIIKLIKRHYFRRIYPGNLYNPFVNKKNLIRIKLKKNIEVTEFPFPLTEGLTVIAYAHDKLQNKTNSTDEVIIEIMQKNHEELIKMCTFRN
jgi:hypothetical protein